MRRCLPLLVIGLLLPTAAPARRVAPASCLRAAGTAAAMCLERYAGEIADCRRDADAACEAAARADGGALDAALARTARPIARRCDETTARALGYLGEEDLLFRQPEACVDFAEDLLAHTFADPPAPSPCQDAVARAVRRVRRRTVGAFGKRCFASRFAGGQCLRVRRDRIVARARARGVVQVVRRCGTLFDGLGLVAPDAGATLEERVGALLDLVVNRARHFAERVYPPNDLGPAADFGPYPIGVRTLALVDPSRTAVAGGGPRPVTVEVYYPSTPDAVAGVPQDVVQVLGVDVVTTPAFRDVARAPGTFPLVLFSHGNNGIRFQSFFFAGHLASHGYVVVTPDHHGNTFVDTLLGIVDAASAVNRPRDLSFLIDQFLAFTATPGHFFEGAIDPDAIGVSGHSFGGYTALAIAGGAFPLGDFHDPRVKAILPQAPAALFPDDFYPTITVPTLILGGSIDETTPFEANQQHPFDELPAGAAVVALGELIDAGHFTFSDFCEVPRDLLAFLGGFDEACEPRHLPWRHAHDIVNYLALSFFDGTLRGDGAALARLAPAALADVEDLVYQAK
jgi:predicted dienelactone hydrolase